MTFSRPSVPVVVQEHLDAAIALRARRSVLVRAPHVQLHRLGRLDDQLLSNLDGLVTAGESARQLSLAALFDSGRSTGFVNTVVAIELRVPLLFERMLSVAETVSEVCIGLRSALGWVSAADLSGLTRQLLHSVDPWWRALGLAACEMHRVDPGVEVLRNAMRSDDAGLRTRALRAAAALGRTDMRSDCLALGQIEGAPVLRFEAARAATLLGERERAARLFQSLLGADHPLDEAALAWALRLASTDEAHGLLRRLRADGGASRTLVRAIGIAGDPHYIPWLIERMQEQPLTRLAGESFTFITGSDLALLDLECKPPALDEADETDDIALDEDDGLPWPDPDRIAAWWQLNKARFTPGRRYFMGREPSVAVMREILATGRQRQREAAAIWLCLLQPGTPLFPTRAPAWRQRRWLARMAG